MRRVICCIMIVLLVGIPLGCQPTPANEIVINKGDGVLERRLKDPQSPKLDPNTYLSAKEWHDIIKMKNYMVFIDASIEMNPGYYPVIRVVPSNFTILFEEVRSLFELLIGDVKEYRDGIFTFEDYKNMISLYSLGRFDFDLYEYVAWTKEEMEDVENEIKELMQKMKEAPMEKEFYASDNYSLSMGCSYTYHNAIDQQWYVSLSENNIRFSKYKGDVYPEDFYLDGIPSSINEPFPTPYPNIHISEEQARSVAESFLLSFNRDAFTITTVERAGMLKPYYNIIEDCHTEAEGFLVTCMRTCGSTIPYDDLSRIMERLYFTDDRYSAPLQKELFQIFITENGIEYLSWENPLLVKETLTESVELLPFSDVQQSLIHAIKNGLSWSDTAYPDGSVLNPTRIGYVNKAIISYTIIPEKNNYGYYLIVPTWLFFYTTEAAKALTAHGYSIQADTIAINAVDGTLIEVAQ